MKALQLLLVCLVASSAAIAQPTTFQWAKNFSATNTNEGLCITTDVSGNVFTTGVLRGSADFDPGPGVFTLTSAGEEDIFISKLDASGNFLWAKQIGSYVGDRGESIAVNANGDVFITGWFSGGAPPEVDFDPGPGVYYLNTVGVNAFILKLNANGDFVWVRSIEGVNSSQLATSIALDAAGNIFVAGSFIITAIFPSVTLTSAGLVDNFVAKYDASGNFLWARQMGGAGSEYLHKMAVDVTGNILLTGYFSETADFDPSLAVFNLVSAGNTDIFACKLDNNGNFIWAKRMGSAIDDDCYGIATDLAGNVFLATPFRGTFDADPGPGVFNVTATGVDAFICKLTAAGDFQWAKRWGASFNDHVEALDIKTDAAGNVYTGGDFTGIVDFDPGPAQFILFAPGNGLIFCSKFDTNGNFLWAVKTGNVGGGIIYSLNINAGNQILSTGLFSQTVDFDPNAGVYNLTAGASDVFVYKLGQSGVLPLTLLEISGASTNEGNLLNWRTAQEINTKDFEVEWSTDGMQYKKIATLPAAGYSNINRQYNYLHQQPAEGYNYYRLKMTDLDGQFSYSNTINIQTRITKATITAFANPFKDILQLSIQVMQKENVILLLHSSDGKIIASKYCSLAKGSNLVNWNLQHIAAGKYFISPGRGQLTTVQVIKL